MNKKLLFILAAAGALLFAGTVLGLGGYFYKINPGVNEVPHDTFTRGLVGYWDFDEGAGQVATDASGNQNHGTLGANSSVDVDDPTWTADSPEEGWSSLSFDGADDYVDCGNDASLDITGAITIEAWVKFLGTPTGYDRIVTKGETGANYGWLLITGNSVLKFGLGYAAGDILTTSTYSLNTWYHVVGVHDGSNNFSGLSLYVNGIKQSTSTIGTFSGFLSNSEPLGIGAERDDGVWENYFNGQIDQVRIYNRALSAEEVRYHYNRGGPVGSWDFDEGSGSIAYDSTGNGNDGVLNNMDDNDWVEGKYGTALDFDGSNDYVDCGDDSSINSLTSDFTVSAWIKSDNIGGGVRRVAASARQTNNGFAFGTNNTELRFTSFGRQDYNSTSITISTGNWYHIVVVFDDSYDALFYVDGIYKETVAGALAVVANTDSFYIGATTLNGSSTLAEKFDGTIDQVRVYDYARTADEILLDYNKGKAAHFGLSETDCSADPASCMDYGLVGNWGMDEGAGTTAQDYSGNNNHGTLENGPTWTKGQSFGGGLSFDGTDDYVDCGNDASLNITGNITVEAWFKTNGTRALWNTIASKITWGTPRTGWALMFFGADRIGFYQDSSSDDGPTYDMPALYNTWVHAVGVYDGSYLRIYVNGDEKDTTAHNTGLGVATNSLQIGKLSYSANYFNGQIDQVRVYNRALSAEEVRYHYNRGGPVASWDFDEGSGSIAYDSTGNGNDGKWNGTGTHWTAGRFGTAGQFADASGDYVSIANNISNAKTISFWTNLDTTTEDIISGDGTGITADSGAMFYGAWDNCFVNGVDTDIITTGWHHVVLTSTSNVFLTAIKLGYTDGGLDGKLDDVKIYQYERSAPEILLDYNKGKAAHFGLATIDCDSDPASCMDYGLVGNWGMDEGAGTTAQDYSGNNNHGTLENGPAWTTDSSEEGGSSLDFDGTDDYVDIVDNSSIGDGVQSGLTVSMWFKSDVALSTDGNTYRALEKGDCYYFLQGNDTTTGAGGMNFIIKRSGTIYYADIKQTLNADQWYHLVGTFDGTDIKVYLDGLWKDTTNVGGDIDDDNLALRIGADDSGKFFNGLIDQVRIYNRALSAEEVRYHYNRGGPVAEWKMNERTGAKIYDSTGNNNDGKLNFGAGANDSYEDMWQGASDNLGIEFDGTDDYVSVGDVDALDGLSELSYTFWAKIDAYSWASMVSKFSDMSNGWGLQMGGTNHAYITIRDGSSDQRATSEGILSTGEWLHFTVVFDGSQGTNEAKLKFYLNGVQKTLSYYRDVPASLPSTAGPLNFGKVDFEAIYFNGLIDQVRIYNRALGASEILESYWEGKMIHP